ncbi:integrase [Pseudochelatococcus contaminans]|uniref:Integrase n=1 Tax=Pseudochelatococcus contaminans TaxID=1538103 RepID=A0A7W6EFK6_9HYPH|nr:integrase [Pseudochelatococcus contaminans]
MSRRLQPPKLVLRPAEEDRGAVWIIYYQRRRYSTGCGESDRSGAQEALERFLAKLRVEDGLPSSAPAHGVFVADALTLYLTEKQDEVARKGELASRIDTLLDFWGDKTLADIHEDSCKDYAKARTTPAAARRELEDLRAAVAMAIRKGICRESVKVTLPPKPRGRVRFMTRDEVARLLWTAWRRKEIQKGEDTAKYTTRHVARYILAALYTGSRSARVHRASFYPEDGRPFFDLDAGIFYRMSPDEKIRPNKRAPPIRIPARLMAHMKRWKAMGLRYPVEYNGKPADPKKAFRATVARARLSDDIVRHTFRHTTVTWLMQAGMPVYDVAGFAGMSEKVVEEVYGHHHPDHHAGISDAFTSGRAGRRKA